MITLMIHEVIRLEVEEPEYLSASQVWVTDIKITDSKNDKFTINLFHDDEHGTLTKTTEGH